MSFTSRRFIPVQRSGQTPVGAGDAQGLAAGEPDADSRAGESDAPQNHVQRLRRAGDGAAGAADSEQQIWARTAHDLRTPLAAILAWTAVLQRAQPDAALFREGLNAIERNARRQAQLIDHSLAQAEARQAVANGRASPADPPEPTPDQQGPELLGGSVQAIADRPLQGIRVLMVDDDVEFREALGRSLRLAGAEVYVAGDGQEALALLRVKRPELLVCDIEMPGVDGHQLLSRIRELSPAAGGSVPALALTGLSGEAHAAAAARSGFQQQLKKTTGNEQVLQTIGAMAAAVPKPETPR